jgi:hypothetical protein
VKICLHNPGHRGSYVMEPILENRVSHHWS